MVDNFSSSPRCRYCDAASVVGPLCPGCLDALPWLRLACPRCAQPQNHAAPCRRCAARPPPFDAAWAAFLLEAPVRQGVHRLKYGADFTQAQMLGRLMAERLGQRASPLPQLLIPVPLHRTRLMRRGYNQALELARVLTQRLALPLAADAAVRVRATPDQIGQSAAQRRRNLRGAFAVTRPLNGLHVALLDDVMTTGATLSELARVVRRAGAARIEAWSLARVA